MVTARMVARRRTGGLITISRSCFLDHRYEHHLLMKASRSALTHPTSAARITSMAREQRHTRLFEQTLGGAIASRYFDAPGAMTPHSSGCSRHENNAGGVRSRVSACRLVLMFRQ